MFDEPSSYLDVKQRLKAAQMIRSLIQPDNYIIVVEHDLSVLDYLSDFICCLYGVPGAYGVVTMPFSVREGVPQFLIDVIMSSFPMHRQCLVHQLKIFFLLKFMSFKRLKIYF